MWLCGKRNERVNRFASAYENLVKSHLDDLDELFQNLIAEEVGTLIDYGPDDSAGAILSTWLSKVYYGLFYYDLATSKNPEWRDMCADIIASENFAMIRRSYEQNHGFCLPSTLYAFRSECTQEFDLRTSVDPQAILLKVDSLVLVLAIADGFLTKQYLRGAPLENLRANIYMQEDANENFPGYLLAWAEILALRVCIPKSPRFIFSDDRITNMSLATMASNPTERYRLDEDLVGQARRRILSELQIVIPG